MVLETETLQRCEASLRKLLIFCRDEGWRGYDPYDGLNSPLAQSSLFQNRLARTALIQLHKRSPINLRPLFGIKKSLNPKGLALAASAVIWLARYFGVRLPTTLSQPLPPRGILLSDAVSGLEADFTFLIQALDAARNLDYEAACWGYNFDWQSRAFFAPRGTPNVVCTVFAAHAYLDWYDLTGSEFAWQRAASSCRFLLDSLHRFEPDAKAASNSRQPPLCFSYTPLDHSQVHNVNLLAAELLARVSVREDNPEFREMSEQAVRYTIARQRADGSWPYGESWSQGWKDNFHTGYVLVSLHRIMKYMKVDGWEENLQRGLTFYQERFFLADGVPKYYDNRLYPIDVHCASQAIITFQELSERMAQGKQRAEQAVDWAIENLQDHTGYFYFQRKRFTTIKIPYLRWAQAWMLYALSLYLSRSRVLENV